MLSQDEWHQRFLQQARWTVNIRHYLFNQIRIQNAERVLEVGCGTGAVLAELLEYSPKITAGIDIDLNRLIFAHQTAPSAFLSAANGLHLPYRSCQFDVTLCHFYLLWVRHPEQAIQEMARVTRTGGHILALAEPDYGGRLDYPHGLSELGRAQERALQKQGADPRIGRRLASLMVSAGLKRVRTGLLGGEWTTQEPQAAWEAEWAVLEDDLQGSFSPADFENLKELDRSAWKIGERILFVPTFYSIGEAAQEENQ